MHSISIGTAGWTIPRGNAADFPDEGTTLERYSTRFAVAEINSSFHRPHRATTWKRWYDSVPAGFCFSVKIPKTITHQAKLADCSSLVSEFLDQVRPLAEKLAVLLVQLPPKLVFDPNLAGPFFRDLASTTDGAIVCEPRHPSWFIAEVDDFLRKHNVARAGADPAICELRLGRADGGD